MRALVWIVEDTWEATVDAAAALLRADAEVTLLHVAPGDVERLAEAGRHGLLGRRRPPGAPRHEARDVSDEAAAALLAERGRAARAARARRRAGAGGSSARSSRPPSGSTCSCSPATATAPGWARRSLGPPARFVVDHAPCAVLLVWPDEAPDVGTIPPPPPH